MSRYEAKCCREVLRSFFPLKIGRCPRCIRFSAWGTLMSWVAAASVSALWPQPVPMAAGLLLAASFTSLLIAHSVAFILRLAALWNARQAGPPEAMSEEFRLARRQFLRAGLATLFGAVFGFSLFGHPGGAHGQQQETCENPNPHTTDIPLAGTKQVCAPNQASAQQAAADQFANDAAAAASTYCMQFTDCPTEKKPDLICDKRKPTLNSKKSAELNVTCTENRANPLGCRGLDKTWDCTGKVTKVWCECQAPKKKKT